MALLVHLPLLGNLNNQGLAELTYTGTPVFKTTGKIGNSAFDLSHRVVFNCPSLDGIKTFSIAFWAKVNSDSSLSTNWVDVISFTDRKSDGSVTGVFRWETCYGGTNYTNWGISVHDNGYYNISDLAGIPQATGKDIWHHIVITVDLENNEVKEYLNGVLVGTATCNGGSLTGAFHLGENNLINGEIQDVRVYSHCLSQKEISELKKMLILHYPLDGNNGTLVNENLAKGTDKATSKLNYSYNLSYVIPSGTEVTISCWIDADDIVLTDSKRIGLSVRLVKTDGSGFQWFETWKRYNNGLSDHCSYHGRISNTTVIQGDMGLIGAYIQNLSSGTVSISQVKVEIGNKVTPWCPNSSDALYTALGYNDGIEYDTSGYGHNGTKVGALSYSIDSPRYLASTVFDGNNSCVRTSNNNWISRPLEEFTVNVWAYKDDWTTYGGQRLFSCTEGAGFNTEQLNSAISFPILVYKNEARTTKGYTDSAYRPLIPLSSISSGWHMFTFTYSTSKISSYLDGALVDSKAYTSYGTYCGDNIPLCIGAEATSNFGTAGGMFVGKMSDFRLYYTCLSDSEIQKLYTVSASIDSNGNAYSAAYVEG